MSVVVAAALAAVTVIATTIHWVRARRRVPTAERARVTRNEGAVYAAGLVLVLGAAVGLFAMGKVAMAIDNKLRSEFAPYTS